MHRDDAARVPLLAEIATKLTVEVDELSRVRLGLREVSGAHLELGQVENAPGGRADALELDRQLEQLEQSRSSACELSRVEERVRELELRALVRLCRRVRPVPPG